MTEVLTGAKLGIAPIYQCCFSDSESLSLHPGGQIAFKSTQSCYVRTLALLAHKQSNAHDKGRRSAPKGKESNEWQWSEIRRAGSIQTLGNRELILFCHFCPWTREKESIL